ncbi:Fe(2+)-trafficking protein [Myxococcota bacterium]|nr:Fe(2+)-trafficking protein [Myxococcota bacterium]
MSDWTCSKCGAGPDGLCSVTGEAPVPLPAPPYHNEYGRRIQAQVCEPTWERWKAQEVMIVNEYRLNLLEREDRAQLRQAMQDFLGLKP